MVAGTPGACSLGWVNRRVIFSRANSPWDGAIAFAV
jgi:hypothetical protein